VFTFAGVKLVGAWGLATMIYLIVTNGWPEAQAEGSVYVMVILFCTSALLYGGFVFWRYDHDDYDLINKIAHRSWSLLAPAGIGVMLYGQIFARETPLW
jgi:hypothetical protein